MSSLQRLLWGLYALIIIVAIGIIGYMVIEGWSFLDAIYMTIISITTAGYKEVHPMGVCGQVFTMFLLVVGVGAALYTFTAVAAYMIEGRLGITLGRRRMKTGIANLKEHFILCGYGQVGQGIGHIFRQENTPFVIIEKDDRGIVNAERDGCLYIKGDATDDEILKEAGIERARGLIIAVGNDADSTYITLSARALRPDLFIEARASSGEAEAKLKRAGADRVIDPHSIGAQRMAMLALRPAVVDFIDTMVRRRGTEVQLELENIIIDSKSSLAGLTIKQIRQCSEANVLAINKTNGKLVANPSADMAVEPGDRLIIMGTREQLAAMEKVCEGAKPNE